jgi:hypothetical protein
VLFFFSIITDRASLRLTFKLILNLRRPVDAVVIASLAMSVGVKHFSSTLRALREERHFALVDGVAFPTVGSLVILFRSGTQSDPCISSVTTAIMITTSNSP